MTTGDASAPDAVGIDSEGWVARVLLALKSGDAFPDALRSASTQLGAELSIDHAEIVLDPAYLAEFTTRSPAPVAGLDQARRPGERLDLPLMLRDRELGRVLLWRDAGDFTPADQERARQASAVLALAIENERLGQLEREQRLTGEPVLRLTRRLNQSDSVQSIAEIAVEELASVMPGGQAAFHQFEPSQQRLVMAAAVGLPIPLVAAFADLAADEGVFGRAVSQGGLAVVGNAQVDDAPERLVGEARRDREGDFWERAVWSLPLLVAGGELLGVLSVFPPAGRLPSHQEERLLQALAQPVARAVSRSLESERAQTLYHAAVATLAAAVDAKDPFTHNHSWQVAALSHTIAQAMNLSPREIEMIELAGLLHDVGKLGIPDRVLQKTEQLDADEWAMMRRHPEFGAKILSDHPALAQLVPLVRHHHERYDGHGYPDQLVGESIPIGAAIVGLADAFDSMTSDRPYRRSRSLPDALAEVERSSGGQFHPRAVNALLLAARNGEITVATSVKRGTTRELRLKRVVGAEARAFGLLQRISAEVSALVEIDRFLLRLNEVMSAEFSDAICNVFVTQADSDTLVAVDRGEEDPGRRQTLVRVQGQGIVGWVAQHGVPQNIADVQEDTRFLVTGHRPIRSELAVPLLVEARCVGVIDLQHTDARAFSLADQQVLEMVATYVAQAIEVADLHHRIKQQADLDALTGLLNHRAFYRRLDEAVDEARATTGQLALAILDLDELKQINDSAGHLAGDAAIRSIAELLRGMTRPEDTVARYGGDEFAIIMPGASRATMESRLHKLDDLVQAGADGTVIAISWGIACYPDDATRPAELVARADRAMYAVKNARRAARRGTTALLPPLPPAPTT